MNAHTVLDSPIGPLFVEASASGLARLAFGSGGKFEAALASAPHATATPAAVAMIERVTSQLQAYFAGTRNDFDLPLDIQGTPFQKRVWAAIAAIPYAATVSYAALAAAAGAPKAYRAAGAACGANPVALVVPCHRVVGSDRGLHGFGGGLPSSAGCSTTRLRA